jgi:hypothetical protein
MTSAKPMTDYSRLIALAVAGLEKNTGDQRRALYERARTALVEQLRGLNPPLTEFEITRERLALEESIRRVESDAARKTRLETPRIDPVTLTRAPDLPPWPDQRLKGFRGTVADDKGAGKDYSRWAVSDPLAELARLIGQDEAFGSVIDKEERRRAEAQRQREEQERQQAKAQGAREEQEPRQRKWALWPGRAERERRRAEAQRELEEQERRLIEEALQRQHEEGERQREEEERHRAEAKRQQEEQERRLFEEALEREERHRAEAKRQREEQQRRLLEEAFQRGERHRAEANRQGEDQERRLRDELLQRQREEAERQRVEGQRQREEQERREREEALRRQHEEEERQRAEAQRQHERQEQREREEALRRQQEEAERQQAEAQRKREGQERRKRGEALRLHRKEHAKHGQIGSPRGSPMSGRIFINYRRRDDSGTAGRLFDRLRDAFQPDQLFFDVNDITLGLDFVKVLEEQISRCDIVLAVIGRNWINARDEAGARRLEKPDDFVRIEIEAALTQGKLVIPVLVDEARMPRADELPDPIKPLIRRHAVQLRHERFRADMQDLIRALQKALDDTDALRRAQAEAARRADKKAERRRAKKAVREQQEQ